MTDFTEMENYFLLNAAFWVAKQGTCPSFHADAMYLPNLIKEKLVVPGSQKKPCLFWSLTEKGRAQAQATAAIFGLEKTKELREQAAKKAIAEQNQDGKVIV